MLHIASPHSTATFLPSPRNCQCTRSSCRVEAKSTEKFSQSCSSSVFPVGSERRGSCGQGSKRDVATSFIANCCGSGGPFLGRCGVPGAGCCGSGAQSMRRHSHHHRRVLEPSPLWEGERRTIGSIGEARRFCEDVQTERCAGQ